MNTFDLGFMAELPKDKTDSLIMKAYSIIEHIRADNGLRFIDAYHEYIFPPENEEDKSIIIAMDLLGIGDSDITVLQAACQLKERMGELLGITKITWKDNGDEVRKMTEDAECYWREKYGLSRGQDDTNVPEADDTAIKAALDESMDTGVALKAQKDKNIKTDAEDELMRMPGLAGVKARLQRIIASRELSVLRSKMGLKSPRSCPHMCFMGNPGTAKTTVARLLKDILFARGILTKDVFIECGRADLVGEHVGETAIRVRDKFDMAMGGILFIDEAYSLYGQGNDFGREAVTTIVQEMENRRDSVMVIFAGYPAAMQRFLEMNEGLKSRIGDTVSFADYSEDELLEIMENMAAKSSLLLSEGAKLKVREIVAVAKTEKNFGNGRFMRQLLEDGFENMAVRVIKGQIDEKSISLMRKCDFTSLIPLKINDKERASRTIGFRLEKKSDKESSD